MNPVTPGTETASRPGERATDAGEALLREREAALMQREAELLRREASVRLREHDQEAANTGWAEAEQDNQTLRQLNDHLVLLTLEAQELKDAAQLARNRQEEFLAMLAHELRNPLGPIRNAVEILSRLDDSAPVPRPILDIIRRQVEHMARLLDDLLDVARVTQGKVTLERRPTAIAEPLGRAIEVCRPLFDQRRQVFTLEVPEPTLTIDGDGVRLAQVFSNLLHNASKYTQPGGSIALRAAREEERVVVRVTDSGMGISPEALPHVFELFAQDKRSIDRSQGGLGIGLTVVLRMVELHGGTVEVRSEGPQRGSEFIVSLPLLDRAPDAAEAPDAGDASTLPGSAPSSAGRVLVIEDNVEAGEVLAELLGMYGHEVEVALDGPAGLRLFDAFRPHVVLCDIGLQGMDGYEVAIRMRERQPANRPTMIALTGYGSAKDQQRALAAGFDQHMVKPADPDALLRLIDAAMLERRA